VSVQEQMQSTNICKIHEHPFYGNPKTLLTSMPPNNYSTFTVLTTECSTAALCTKKKSKHNVSSHLPNLQNKS